MKIIFSDFSIELTVNEYFELTKNNEQKPVGGTITFKKKKLGRKTKSITTELNVENGLVNVLTDSSSYNANGVVNPKAAKPVDVLIDGVWVTFDSINKAAKRIEVSNAWLGKSLELGKTANGFHVRWHGSYESKLSSDL